MFCRQIKELISWEQSQAAKTIGPHHQKVYSQMDSESSSIKNPLEKFETSCKESKKLLKSFRKNIYRPLCDFFTSENLESPIRDVHQKLEKCLHKWETLVDSSHINEKLFSKESEKAIFKNSLKNRTYEFDTILRFVPDLSEKQVEVLRLARRWRLMVTSTNNGRRGTFTLTDNTDKLLGKRKELLPLRISKEHSGEEQLPENTRPSFCERGKILKDQSVESRKISRDENIEGRKISRDQSIEGRKISQELLRPVRTSRDHSVLGNKNRSYENLEHEYKKTHEKYTDVLIELNDTKIKYSAYEEKLDEYQKECLSLKRELKYAKESCKILEEKLTDSQRLDSVSSIDDVSASQGYLTVLRKELDNAKMKYCSQRIKLMNAKKRVQLLNTQLVESQQHQQKLQKELHNSRNKCSKLQEQLEISRKNLNTQGSMIDALQHQCYTLKQELDESNATKGELFNRLETAEERCRTMESQLDLTLQRCKTLEHDLRESKSREEGLERENTCLQALCTGMP